MFARSHRARTLVMGIGNVLLSDDGVGVRAIEALADLPLPDGVELCDAGTGGSDMASMLESRDRVIVLDAVDAGLAPGTILRRPACEFTPGPRSALSVHDFHLLDGLQQAELRQRAPAEVIVLAVQVGNVDLGLQLSSAVSAAVPRLVDQVIVELARGGARIAAPRQEAVVQS